MKAFLVGGVFLLAGCAVGPDYVKPAAPDVTGYTKEKLATQVVADHSAANPDQTFVPGLDIPGEWWTLFRSEALNSLITRALRNNPDLEAAQASLKQARENVYAQEGSFFPSVSGSFSPSRNKTATASLSPATASGNPYYSLSTAQLSVSYNPDVWVSTGGKTSPWLHFPTRSDISSRRPILL